MSMNGRLRIPLTAFALLATLVLIRCNTPVDVSGNSGKAGNGGNCLISGYLVDAQGNPAKGAKVRFVPVGYNPHASAKALAAIDSTTTDSTGWYGFEVLQPGTYNRLACSSDLSELAYMDSLSVTTAAAVLPHDT